MATGGREAKVLDFGLAKALSPTIPAQICRMSGEHADHGELVHCCDLDLPRLARPTHQILGCAILSLVSSPKVPPVLPVLHPGPQPDPAQEEVQAGSMHDETTRMEKTVRTEVID
jgi:hypothetical protein